MSYTYIHHGTVIDGTGREPIVDGAVLIHEDRLAAVGPAASVRPPQGESVHVIDAEGGAILPGFIDCHVHITSQAFAPERYFTPFTYSVLKVVQYARTTVEAGVTTIRDAGGADRGIQQAFDQGLVLGPRSQIAVAMLSITGGHGDSFSPALGLELKNPLMVNGVCDGIDGVRKKVREVIRAGAQVIKVATSGGVISPTDKPEDAHFTLEELRTMVDEAKMHGGIRAMAHAQAAPGIKNAVKAGFLSIEHGIYLDDEAIELMLQEGTYLVPTLIAPLSVLRAKEAGHPVPDYAVEKTKRVIEAHQSSIARAHRAGVKIAFGTDSGVGPHGTNLQELALLTEVGLSPMQALVAATHTAAELLGFDDRVGTLEEGKLADVVVSRTNPLDHIESLAEPANIRWVLKGGSVVKGVQ